MRVQLILAKKDNTWKKETVEIPLMEGLQPGSAEWRTSVMDWVEDNMVQTKEYRKVIYFGIYGW